MSVCFAVKSGVQLLLLLTSFLAFVSAQQLCDNAAKGLTIDDNNARKVMHDYLNDIRKKVAEGNADNYRKKKLPAAKNMYKLQYDCDMEKKLQDEIDKCTGEATLVRDYAQNIVRLTSQQVVALDHEVLPAALQTWYDPVRYYGLKDNQNRYKDERLQSFANMIYANATKVACYYKTCVQDQEMIVSCIFNLIGAYKNNKLYETGGKCTQNSDCTTYKDSTCEMATGLCEYKGDIGSGESTMCKGNPAGMVDEGRTKVLNAHNYRRGLLARGLIRNGKNPNNRNLSTAYYMPRMTYDCDVEAEAIKYAQTCKMRKSAEADRQGYGENVYVHKAPHAEPVSTFDAAVKSWWTQIFEDGINWGLKFTESLRDKTIDQKGFTQMAWAKTTKLGCAIQTCGPSSFVVCRYSPAGNVVNELIYQPGRTCAGCVATCNQTDGLC